MTPVTAFGREKIGAQKIKPKLKNNFSCISSESDLKLVEKVFKKY